MQQQQLGFTREAADAIKRGLDLGDSVIGDVRDFLGLRPAETAGGLPPWVLPAAGIALAGLVAWRVLR